MTTELVLIQPPGWAVMNPPLGLALLKAYLGERGFSVKVMDLNIELYNKGAKAVHQYWDLTKGYFLWQKPEFNRHILKAARKPIAAFMDRVVREKPRYVGFSVHDSTYLMTLALAGMFRSGNPEIPIIFGGPQMARQRPEWKTGLMGPEDVVVFGEGEEAVHEILQGKEHVPGTATLAQDNGLRPQIRDLDALPFPDFGPDGTKGYAQPDFLPTYFSRGCLNHCMFCTESLYFPTFHTRTGRRVHEEIRYLHDRYGISRFRFAASVSNGSMWELKEFCDRLIANGPKIQFVLDGVVVRQEMTPNVYRKLRKAGCTLMGFGLETPSKRLLEHVGKVTSKNADLEKVIMDGVDSGIRIAVNFMFGIPGETEEESLAQIAFIRKIPWWKRRRVLLVPSLTLCAISPGSRAAEDPARYGLNLSKGQYHWESLDGTNTFETRKAKFNRFLRAARWMGYPNLLGMKTFEEGI